MFKILSRRASVSVLMIDLKIYLDIFTKNVDSGVKAAGNGLP